MNARINKIKIRIKCFCKDKSAPLPPAPQPPSLEYRSQSTLNPKP